MGIFADTIKVVRSNIFKSILKNGDYSVKKLSFPKKIIVDLPSDEEASFDGSADITTGTKGVLPLIKGGTGATDAGEARKKLGTVYCGRHSPDKRDVGMGSNDDYMWLSFYDISSGKSEALNFLQLNKDYTAFKKPVEIESGGTGATSAEGALKNLGISVPCVVRNNNVKTQSGRNIFCKIPSGKTLDNVHSIQMWNGYPTGYQNGPYETLMATGNFWDGQGDNERYMSVFGASTEGFYVGKLTVQKSGDDLIGLFDTQLIYHGMGNAVEAKPTVSYCSVTFL